jgi:glycosyltransferase involved in cell wall biosynthesis
VKVVILHDWLTGFRGGERVLEALCEMYPDAPIYTLIHDKGSTSPLIESKEIITSFLNKIPGISKHYRKFLPLMPLAVEMMKITHKADLVISSSHCVIKGVKKPEGSKHICYIHSPMRYMYDQYDNYFRKSPIHIKMAAWLSRPFLQWWDKRSNRNVDHFIPNSKFVQKRIQSIYEVGSSVVYPFVDLEDFNGPRPKKEDFYLMVTAFAPNKRLDIAIDAFNHLDKKLKIIGKASDKELTHFKSLITKGNIEFLGELPREEVVSHIKKAKAFIFPGVEDFGITPLESMASGTPVIAYEAGGVLETVTEDTGIFFKNPSSQSLVDAINRFAGKEFNEQELLERANVFSKNNFINNMNNEIHQACG